MSVVELESGERTDPAEGPDVACRVVVITGAGQGIGRVFAKAYAAAGAIVIVAELSAERGTQVADEIVAEGGTARAIATDVADDASVRAMVDAVEAEFGRIDILINNAAIFSSLAMRPFFEIPLDEWDAVLRVNVTGTMLAAKAVLPAMRRAKWGRIINISSSAVTVGRANYLHYTTSKAAVIGMTRSMARELGPFGITVNAILPGATFTEVRRGTVSAAQKDALLTMQCIPRFEEPADLVAAVMFLGSSGASFVTGQCLTVDGGGTHG